MEESKFVWINGEFVPWADANVHFLNHSLHYGSAVFEGIRCYSTPKGSAVFRLKDHIKRLFFSASVMGMKIPFTESELVSAALELVKRNDLKECYVRPLVYFSGKMGMDTIGAKVDVGIACWPWGAYLGEDGLLNGVSIKISPYIRPPNNIMPTSAKVAGNYVNSILAKMDALNTGYKDAVLLDLKGNVAECSGENIFFIKGGTIITPSLENALDGITRKSIIQISKDFGVKVEERAIKKEEIFSADECFMTGTAAELSPVVLIDNKKVGAGKVGELTKNIQTKFYEVVHGKDPKYLSWLDFV